MNKKHAISKSDRWLWAVFTIGLLLMVGAILNYLISLNAMFTVTDDAVNLCKPIVITAIVLFVYLIPAIFGRKTRRAAAIAVLNLYLGWTVIGWIVALVCASIKDRDSIQIRTPSGRLRP